MPGRCACVAVVDPVLIGSRIASEILKRGYLVIAVWSKEVTPELRAHAAANAREWQYHASVEEQTDIVQTASAVRYACRGFRLLACMGGFERGVALSDGLAEQLGLCTTGARRDRLSKSGQQQCIKASGIRAVREALGTCWSQVKTFVEGEAMPVVVKPLESRGSGGLKLCHSTEEAEMHFKSLLGVQREVGGHGTPVLVQEYLQGKEYVVEHVSRGGMHKTVMVWLYDNRPSKGANFVYFGTLPVPADTEIARVLIEYTRGVLDSLGVRYGPSHSKIVMTADGPCLVQMKCRAHGGDGALVPLARELTGGYSQVDAALDAHLDKEAFDKLPDAHPSPFPVWGQEVLLVCPRGGTVTSTHGLDKLCELRSFVSLDTSVAIGSKLSRSSNLLTCVGSLILMHPDESVFQEDLHLVRWMETECALLSLEDEPPPTGERGDPPAEPPAAAAVEEARGLCDAPAGRVRLRRLSRSEVACGGKGPWPVACAA